MLREIKFRGRRVDNGDWVYGSYQADVLAIGKHTIIYANKEGFYCEDEIDPETVGQYTGLHDREGKEIYEGDILATWNTNPFYDVWDKTDFGYTEVAWVKECDCLCGNRWTWDKNNLESVYDISFVEVIGNRFEHPHLLKGE